MHPASLPFSSLAHALDSTNSYVPHSPLDTYLYGGPDILGGPSCFPQSRPPPRDAALAVTSVADPSSRWTTVSQPLALLRPATPAALAVGLTDAWPAVRPVSSLGSFPAISGATSSETVAVVRSGSAPLATLEAISSSEITSARPFSTTSELQYPSVKPEPGADDVLPPSPSPSFPASPSTAAPPQCAIEPKVPEAIEDWVPNTLEELLAPPAPRCVPLRTTGASPEMRRMMGVFRLDPFARHDGVHAAVRSGYTCNGDEPNVRLRDRAICWNGEQAGPLREDSAIVEFQIDLKNPDNLVPYQVQFPHLYPRSITPPPCSPESLPPQTPQRPFYINLSAARYTFPSYSAPGYFSPDPMACDYPQEGLPYAFSRTGAVMFGYAPSEVPSWNLSPQPQVNAYNYNPSRAHGPLMSAEYASLLATSPQDMSYYLPVYA